MLLKRQPPKALAQALVLLLWGIVPLSWVYVIAYIAIRSYFVRDASELWRLITSGRLPWQVAHRRRLVRWLSQRGLFCYALLESSFSIYYRLLARKIQGRAGSHTATREFVVRAVTTGVSDGLEDIVPHLEQSKDKAKLPTVKAPLAFDDPRAVEFRHEMAGWFLGVRPEHISLHDVQDWLSWSLFGKYYEEVIAEDSNAHDMKKFLAGAVDLFAARRGLPFPEKVDLTPKERRNKRVMLLTLDPVHVNSRPLAMYVGTFLLNRVSQAYFSVLGMHRYEVDGYSYLIYMPAGWTPDAAARGEAPRPALFLHGLGLGVVQYITAVQALVAPGGRPAMRPLLVPLQPWVSYEFFSKRFLRPWKYHEASTSIRHMLERHQLDKCGVNVLSHSMGTIVHTWLMRAWPELIHRSLFVDPVCFQLWAPHICYRFLYKPTDSFVEYVLRYFVARELGTANVLMRHFDWSANVLLADDLPERSDPSHLRIYLAGADTVVKASSVIKFLKRSGFEERIEYEPDFHHGEFILGPKNMMGKIVQALDQYSPM